MEKDCNQQIPIVIIQGSVRPHSYTSMAVALVADEFRKHSDYAVKVIDPAGLNLPWPGTNSNSPDAAALQADVKSAAGVVLATPEYHGTFSSVMKLVIENLGFPSV